MRHTLRRPSARLAPAYLPGPRRRPPRDRTPRPAGESADAARARMCGLVIRYLHASADDPPDVWRERCARVKAWSCRIADTRWRRRHPEWRPK